METLTNGQNEVQYAGFWLRFVAYIIDDLIMGFVGFLISIPFIGGIIFSAIGIGENPENAKNMDNGKMKVNGW